MPITHEIGLAMTPYILSEIGASLFGASPVYTTEDGCSVVDTAQWLVEERLVDATANVDGLAVYF